jgi:hypothetical protein
MCACQGPSISSGPEDWPPLALRRSAKMQRYSPLNSSMGLKGLPLLKPEIVEFHPTPDVRRSVCGQRRLVLPGWLAPRSVLAVLLPFVRTRDRSTKFCRSRIFPGQSYLMLAVITSSETWSIDFP